MRFWVTPPVHGCLAPFVVHPAAFTYKLPDNVSFAEGAIVELLSIGLQAAKKAAIRPGDVAIVLGAGTIGMMCALAALAGGCSRAIVCDLVQEKLDLIGGVQGVTAVNIREKPVKQVVSELTDGWGADIVFEASGNEKAFEGIVDLLCPGGCIVLVGMPQRAIPLDVVAVQIKEARIESVFRYANIFPRDSTHRIGQAGCEALHLAHVSVCRGHQGLRGSRERRADGCESADCAGSLTIDLSRAIL